MASVNLLNAALCHRLDPLVLLLKVVVDALQSLQVLHVWIATQSLLAVDEGQVGRF